MKLDSFYRVLIGDFARILLVASLVLTPSLCAHAQVDSSAISGIVADETGAVLPGAEVEIKNVNTNAVRTTTTSSFGFYVFRALRPGTYEVTARMARFRTVSVTGIVLNVQDDVSRNIKLRVGDPAESVTVTAESEKIESSAAVGTVIDREMVQNLPLDGRSFQSLILLTPGVTIATTSANDYGQFSVNGQRASTNYFTVDGVSANIGTSTTSGGATNTAMGGAYPGLSAFGGTNNLVSVDALEEFRIQTSTYTAELGRQPGGQIVLVSRSGTNEYHGSLFEYFRNDAMDARDAMNRKPYPKPPLRQNDFGGTFGGPLYKDKTFFFFSYEGQRLRLPQSGIIYVPSLRLRDEAKAANSTVVPVLNAIPAPTGDELTDSDSPCTPDPSDPTCAPSGLLYTGWSPRNYSLSNPSSMDATSIRFDQIVSPRLNFFGRFNESPSYTKTFSGAADGNADNASTLTATIGSTVTITPKLIDELRFNYSRQKGQQQYIQATYGGAVPVDPKLLTGGNSGYGFAIFTYGGNAAYVNAGDIAANYQQQWNLVDSLSLVKGKHEFKVGIDYRKLMPTYGIQNQAYEYFMSESDVTSSTATITNLEVNERAKPRFTNLSLFGQDSWKMKPRLTFDFGLRWELNPAPTEADGQMPPVILGVSGNPPNLTDATLAPQGTPFYKTFYTAFAPRVGAAYQLLKGKQETVLRGGFGVYYDLGTSGATGAFPLTAYQNSYFVPFPLSGSDATLPVVEIVTSLPTTTTVWSNEPGLKLPFTLQWNVSVEQSLGKWQSASASYVGSAARRLLTTQGINLPTDYYSGSRPNPNFGSIMYSYNGPTSDYDSLQLQYKAHFTNLQALLNYTWSHAIDMVSTDAGYFVLTRGNADFDIRQNLSAALTYNLPSPEISRVPKSILSNWFLDGIVHAQSGLPVNIVAGSNTVIDGMSLSVRPDRIPGVNLYVHDSSVPGGRRFNVDAFSLPPPDPNNPDITVQGNLGRNVMRGLPLYQADLGAGRRFPFVENTKLIFKTEAFNILNHPMYSSYDTYWHPGSSTFGIPTSTLSRALGGLSPLYQIGGPRSIQVSLRIEF